MLIRKTPKDIDNYFVAEPEEVYAIQKEGIDPVYMDAEFVYFKKSNELTSVLKKLGISEL